MHGWKMKSKSNADKNFCLDLTQSKSDRCTDAFVIYQCFYGNCEIREKCDKIRENTDKQNMGYFLFTYQKQYYNFTIVILKRRQNKKTQG